MTEEHGPSPVEHELFDPHILSIATATFYPHWYGGDVTEEHIVDKIRGDLALASARKATKQGFQLSVVDGGSSKSFITALAEEHVDAISQAEKGMGPSRRQAFQEASEKPGAGVIIWMEPEKVSLIDSLDRATAPIRSGAADIVIPTRNALLFQETYPDYQYESEVEGNKVFNAILRSRNLLHEGQPDLDMYFGPKIFANRQPVRDLFQHVYAYTGSREFGANKYIDPDKYSNVQMYPVVAGLSQGLRVASVEVPFRYPSTQKHIEESTDASIREAFVSKRRAQRNGVTGELIEFIRYLDNNPQKMSHLRQKD